MIANSDHCAVSFAIKTNNKSPGRGYWRHNDSLNNDVDFVKYIKNEIKTLDVKDITDKRAAWEYVKFKVRELSRQYAMNKAKEGREHKLKLQTNLDHLNNSIMKGTGDTSTLRLEMENVRVEMDKVLETGARAIMFRSKVKFIEEGEKVTAYFFRAVKQNMARSNIEKINIAGSVCADQHRVSKFIHDYYKDLYSFKSHINIETEMLSAQFRENLPQISQTLKDFCDKPISKQEIKTTLFQKMNPGKSPGNDGLTVGLLKSVWDEVENYFYDSVMESIIKGKLPTSQRQSVIRLIQKKEKDKLNIDNWRPISLLNVDTKIISKLLAIRIEKCLEDIIHEDQGAFVPNRYIGEGIRKLQYICEYYNTNGLKGALLAIDFKKAFDSVSHEFLWQTMESFGFGKGMINMIKLLYRGAESAVMNEGISSKYFSLERSCRQGDCLSPYLFIIAIEPLLKQIRDNQQIEGLRFRDNEYKVTAYADDLTLTIRNREGISAAVKILKDFAAISGLEINMNKSELMGLGKWRDRIDLNEWGFERVEHLKITGIHLGHDVELVEKLNFEPIINKAQAKLAQWRTRHLSLLGKVVAVKSHGLALFQFVASIISVPKWAIIQINKLVYRFIWGGIDKISRKIACLPLKEGGINIPMMQDIVHAAQVQWLRRKARHPDRLWTKFLDADIQKLGGYPILSGGLNKKTGRERLMSYNKDIIQTWSTVSSNPEPDNTEELLKVSLWHNSEIVDAKGIGIFSKRLNNIGIITVQHRIQNDGSLIPINKLEEHGISRNLYLEWASVCRSIPAEWIRTFRTKSDLLTNGEHRIMENTETQSMKLYFKTEIYPIEKCTQKVVLNIIRCKRIMPINKYKSKMSDKYNIRDQEWQDNYKYIMQFSISSRNRSFMWRFLYGIVYTNEDFFKFGFKENKNCSFCQEDGQSKKHLFLTCPKVVAFRKEAIDRYERIFLQRTIDDKSLCLE